MSQAAELLRAQRRSVNDRLELETADEPGDLASTGVDPLLLALARYVQALDHRYPGGPAQMRRQVLDARANMPIVMPEEDGPAA